MTDTQNTPNGGPDEDRPTPALPLGYWLRAVEAMIGREFATALAAEDSYDHKKTPQVEARTTDSAATELATATPNDHKKPSLREVQPLGVERHQQREEVVLVHLRGPLPVEALT